MRYSLVTIALLYYSTCLIGQAPPKSDSLYVFVGQKIEVKKLPEQKDIQRPDTIRKYGDSFYLTRVRMSMDYKYSAKYKVLQNVYGSFKADTIEFIAYDHYGVPAFSEYEFVLLYVANNNGRLIHEKYQFADVYKTTNGRWAGAYWVRDYQHRLRKDTLIKPEPIDFKKQVSYSIKKRSKEDISRIFPSPYFAIKGKRAFVIQGNYVEDLFLLKKDGILKARGFFTDNTTCERPDYL